MRTQQWRAWSLASGLALPVVALVVLLTGLTGAARTPAAGQANPGRPGTSVAGASLSAVSCPQTGWCMAVGYAVSSRTAPSHGSRAHASHSLAEVWNGKVWRILKDVPGTSMHGVTCSAPWFCMTQGSAGTQTWNGTSWRKIEGPSEQASPISCGGRRLCTVLSSGGAGTGAVGEVWNGSTWRTWTANTSQCLGYPPSGPCGLADVACGNAVDCMSVGTATVDQAGEQSGESVNWNGKSWTRTGTLPWDGDPAAANAVSCASYFCMAVGGADQMDIDGDVAVAAIWTASTGWQDASPNLGTICTGYGTCGWTSQISCGSPTNCMAFGSHGDLDWNGSTWRNDPAVSAGPGSRLTGLSCRRAICFAVGTQVVNGSHASLAELFNGSIWTIVPTPAVS